MSRLALAGVVAAVAMTVGCGSSPPSTFYALAPTTGGVVQAQVHTIKLRRPGLAGYLDRPEIVRKVVDYRLGVTDTDRWAAPLDEMLGRVLAQDIEQRVPGSSVFTEDGPITADPDTTVEVDVRRFDVGDNGDVNLVAEVATEKAATHTVIGTRAVRLTRRLSAGGTTPELVKAMSDLLGELADQIAVLLRGG